VLAFPRGATPIDFAFRVHTEVGNHCVGARINGRLVPLRTVLSNGDIVEILTSPNQVPSRDWLDLAVTAKAKNKIRTWLNRGEKEQAVDGGGRLLDRECRKLGLSAKQLGKDGTLARIASDHGFGKEEDFLAAIGFGRLSAHDVLLPLVRAPRPLPSAESIRREVISASTVAVRGQTDMLTFRARCCNPLPGDEIVGYITRGRGVAVHAASCHNVRRLLFSPERAVEVEWQGAEKQAYPAALTITFDDRPGMLAAITQTVTGVEANIRSCQMDNERESGIVDLLVDIRGRDHLERLFGALRRIPGVVTVAPGLALEANRSRLG
jgi:guanosine-3',5'-bis(diphosphate) 3'-pyrophosphohydrolase